MLDAATTPRDRAYLATALNTGLRSNEIVRLRIGDVSLDSGSLFVTISKTREEDSLPISADLDEELRRWILAYQGDVGRPLRRDDPICSRRARAAATSGERRRMEPPSDAGPHPVGPRNDP